MEILSDAEDSRDIVSLKIVKELLRGLNAAGIACTDKEGRLGTDVQTALYNLLYAVVTNENGIKDLQLGLQSVSQALDAIPSYKGGTGITIAGDTIGHSNNITAATVGKEILGTEQLEPGKPFTLPWFHIDETGHVDKSGSSYYNIAMAYDSELSNTSKNAVQNKAVKAELDKKLPLSGGNMDNDAKIVIPLSADGRKTGVTGGGIKCKIPSNAGFAMGYGWYTDDDFSNVLGSIGAYGTNNDISYFFVGGTYNNPLLKVNKSDGSGVFKGGVTATKFNGYTLATACARGVTTASAKTHTNYGTNNTHVPDMAFLAYWNGAYNSSGSSNITYCVKGAFGDAAIKGVDTTATSGSSNLITSGAMYTALAGKAASSHGTHVTFSTTVPAANGTAAAGSAATVSRSDHVHPLQTSVSGNAGTATKLATARTINGVSFDGSSNIKLFSGNSWTVGTNSASSAGYYKFMSKTMKQYEDFNMTLAITNEFSSNCNGILAIHIRCDSSTTTNAPNVLGWLVRYGWTSDSVIAIVNGLTVDFYINQTVAQYGGIRFTVISESGLRGTTTYNTVSSTTPTTGLTASKTSYDSGVTNYANYWSTSRNINGLVVNGSANRVNYGTCSTAAATAAKVVACSGFALVTGAEITVKFTVTNTASSPALNVNSTGAKPIYYRGAAISAGYLAANRTYTFRYNGTQYDLVGDINTDTNTDTRVAQTGTTANYNYRLLLSYSANDTTETNGARKSTNFYANPSTGTMTAKYFNATSGGELLASSDCDGANSTFTITIADLTKYSYLLIRFWTAGIPSASQYAFSEVIPVQYLVKNPNTYIAVGSVLKSVTGSTSGLFDNSGIKIAYTSGNNLSLKTSSYCSGVGYDIYSL